MRHSLGRTRLRLVADGRRSLDGRARVGEKERADARALVSAARRDGCFGASDAGERMLEAIDAASAGSDLAALVAEVEDLVPETLRQTLLGVLRAAHVDGRLSFEEFEERTARCLGPLHADEADAMVRDLGHRVVHAPSGRARRHLVATASVVGPPVLVGVALGGAVAAVPAALSVPGATAEWVPLAVACGVFSALAAGVSSVAWRLRRRRAAIAPTPGADAGSGPER